MNHKQITKKLKSLEENDAKQSLVLNQMSTALTEQLSLIWAIQEHIGIKDSDISESVAQKRQQLAELRNQQLQKKKSPIIR